jgi:hypothetical protein
MSIPEPYRGQLIIDLGAVIIIFLVLLIYYTYTVKEEKRLNKKK